jgi:predicted component of type VI protein secretion system
MPPDDQARIGKLVLSAENRVLREVLIDRKRLTIGRRPHNDLLLDDLTVSGEHAIVHTVAGESVIQDLMSRNGTLINGAPVSQQQLVHGDCVDIGIYRLVYKIERVAARRSTYGFWSAFMPTSLPSLPTNLAGQRTSAWVPSRPVRYPVSSRPPKQGAPVNPGLAGKPGFRAILPKARRFGEPGGSGQSHLSRGHGHTSRFGPVAAIPGSHRLRQPGAYQRCLQSGPAEAW